MGEEVLAEAFHRVDLDAGVLGEQTRQGDLEGETRQEGLEDVPVEACPVVGPEAGKHQVGHLEASFGEVAA